MRNLFIMHTQYNLILSASVVSRHIDDDNTLVLYAEFELKDELRQALFKVFDRVIVVRDNFYSSVSALDEIKQIRCDMKKVKTIKKVFFDNIYMSQERIFDMIVCARAKKINPDIKCYNIEEDAYYSINNKYNADDFVYKESRRMKRRKFLYAIMLLGYPYNYKDISYCYGMSSEYHGANLLFPDLARKELSGKEKIEITRGELIEGISAIYSDNKIELPDGDKYTVFFFDLMQRYENPEKVKEIVKKIIKTSQEEDRVVLLKYHPRETEKFNDIGNAFEIPHIIPAEKVLLDIQEKDVVVIGNSTTSCWVASKFGYKVLSICKIEFPDNKKMHTVMESMGITCIENI